MEHTPKSCCHTGREASTAREIKNGVHATKATKRKGFIGRFLERLEKANQSEFGDKGPSCCN